MAVEFELSVMRSLVRVHRVITRGLNVALDASQSFIDGAGKDGRGADGATGAGFVCYVRSLASVLDGHHQAEEIVAFPFFRQKGIEAPYAVLAQEHERMGALIPVVRGALDRLQDEEFVAPSLRTLHGALVRVKEAWDPHIRTEETCFNPVALGRLSPDEHVRLSRGVSEFTQRHSGPDYLVLPFIFYNLPAEERPDMSLDLPPQVTQQLVPVVWREKWAPMARFFLDV